MINELLPSCGEVVLRLSGTMKVFAVQLLATITGRRIFAVCRLQLTSLSDSTGME